MPVRSGRLPCRDSACPRNPAYVRWCRAPSSFRCPIFYAWRPESKTDSAGERLAWTRISTSELAAAQELAERLARGPATAYALIKRGLYRSQESDLETMLEVEAMYQEAAGRAPDFREGLAAFRDKRPPRFA